jgi:hypothetical protein
MPSRGGRNGFIAAVPRWVTISGNGRHPPGFFLLVLVVVLAIGNAKFGDEDEKEDEDDLVPAVPR